MQYQTLAQTSKQVRAALKAEFKGVKFSVSSKSYSGGSSMSVSWVDGPTFDQVRGFCEQFEGAYFDASQDLKVYKHNGSGVDYISQRRNYSREFCEMVLEELKAEFKCDVYPVVTGEGNDAFLDFDPLWSNPLEHWMRDYFFHRVGEYPGVAEKRNAVDWEGLKANPEALFDLLFEAKGDDRDYVAGLDEDWVRDELVHRLMDDYNFSRARAWAYAEATSCAVYQVAENAKSWSSEGIEANPEPVNP